ncbi:hypothetical protein NDA01_28355 [Trichocoleus desertorum AS-A10]
MAEVNVPTPRSDEEKFVQYEMVAAGWAYPYEKFSDHCPNWDIVQKGVNEAKQNQRGVWAVAPAVKPKSDRPLMRGDTSFMKGN